MILLVFSLVKPNKDTVVARVQGTTMLVIVLFGLVLLKIIVLLFIYNKIKYHDDGFEKVTLAEFVTIHVTFPVTNAWISYTLVYVLFVNFANYCNYDFILSKVQSDPS